MKFALKIISPYIKNDWRARRTGIPTGKLYFLQDEKAVFNFLRHQMKQDLLDPIGGQLRWTKETVSPSDTLGIYSYLYSANLDFHFLCYSGRVRKFLNDSAGIRGYMYGKMAMIRSLPFNYTIYKLQDDIAGSTVMRSVNWNRFIKQSMSDGTITKDDIKYVSI